MILNIVHGQNVSARKVKDQKDDFLNNANNLLAYNVVDGPVTFMGYGTEQRHCVKGPNYVVKGEKTIENKLDGLEVNEVDEEITLQPGGGNYHIDRAQRNLLARILNDPFIGKILK